MGRPGKKQREGHEEARARVRAPGGVRREEAPRPVVKALGQDVDGLAEGAQQCQRLPRPAHLFGAVLLGGEHRERQDEGARASDGGPIEEMRIGQPFPHLPAAIDQSEVGDAGARAVAEPRRVVEAHDGGGRVDRGGSHSDLGGIADDGEGTAIERKPVIHLRRVDLDGHLRQGFEEQRRYGAGHARQGLRGDRKHGMPCTRRCFVCGADLLAPSERTLVYPCGRRRSFPIACGSCGILLEPDADPARCRAHLGVALSGQAYSPDPEAPYGLDLYTLRSAATRFGLGVRHRGPEDDEALRHPHSQRAAWATLYGLAEGPEHPVSLGLLCRPQELDAVLTAVRAQVSWTDDIVILLDASTITKAGTSSPGSVRVEARPMEGDYAAQRNALQERARHSWMLQLDADEALDPVAGRLLPALAALADAGDVLSVGLPRVNRVDGIPSDVYPDVQYRLNRTSVRYAGRVHERPALEGGWPRSFIALHGAIEHRLSRAHVLARSRRYEALDPGRGRLEEEAALLRPYRD